MLSKEEIEKAIVQNEDIITYKADKDFRGLTSSEKTLLENNRKIKEYIDQLEQENNKQNKIIDEMALAIASYDIDEEICKNQVMPLCDKSSLEVTVDVCAKCIKQYFEEKVEGE